MRSEIKELISLLQNDEIDFIHVTDKRALKMKIKYGNKDVMCFGVLVPKEYNKEICDYYYDESLKLYLKD